MRIEIGETYFWSSSSDFHLDTGTGHRTADQFVTFNPPFTTKPEVLVALQGFAGNKDFNTHIEVRAKSVTIAGFEVEVLAHDDCQLSRVKVSWLACGE